MTFAYSPHPKAPMFANETNPETLIKQAIQEMTNLQTTESVRELIRQIGFVNLWFFEKFIAGYNGPFNKLNSDLHLDMANFIQSYVLPDGSRCAIFAPRWHFKSSVGTTGFEGWYALREPERTNGLFHAKYEDAVDFMHVTQRIFDSNPFFEWAYKEYVPEPNQKRWNDNEMYLPPTVKTRYTKEATLECGSVGGTNQGKHYSGILHFDDIVGEQDLDSTRASNVDMVKKGNWMQDMIRALVTHPEETSVFVLATRYSSDDAYSFIEDGMKTLLGYDPEKLSDYETHEDGNWTVYWRFIKENNKIIFPERVTEKWLADVMEKNPWFYWTQLENRPHKSGSNELLQYEVKKCKLLYHDDRRYEIQHDGDKITKLSTCDVVQAADPAGCDRQETQKTSRQAQAVVAHAPDNKRFIVAGRAKYTDILELYNWFFSAMTRFKDYMRGTFLEAQGPFKVLIRPLRQQEQIRNISLNLQKIDAVGKKEIRIRNAFLPLVESGLLYVEESIWDLFWEEYRKFPGGLKKDFLDAITHALNKTSRPPNVDEEHAKEEAASRRFFAVSQNVAGY